MSDKDFEAGQDEALRVWARKRAYGEVIDASAIFAVPRSDSFLRGWASTLEKLEQGGGASYRDKLLPLSRSLVAEVQADLNDAEVALEGARARAEQLRARAKRAREWASALP